ncbi:hypothetical protein BCR33DRAFT_764134 [Rhizoclosmatium globosum]|uniref:Cytokinin riboside 5'-monophosphate phosphoribohydrolase n=1 Tax=Rhizoclosmatium globosum TaxID=329046 RepID=A0A1Y2CL66_9FUNG|nr:hypothetical protein BCR33DRAFT_764134 [Rhizoclosmatium globosum]|eukprot:ORY47743.1 hypothetical protein BCR33DRAFT_764134 [Rhizoclosmatium globosum]
MTSVNDIKNVCVFCGSSKGNIPVYLEAAREFSEKLVSVELVSFTEVVLLVSIMGAVATTAIEKGGRVVGIIPEAMVKGFGGALPGETIIVNDMHTRKSMFVERSDAFIALPGGIGTFEEILECLTWSQLSIHSKPIVILNTNGFYDALKMLLDRAVQDGFMSQQNRELATFVETPAEAVDALFTYQLPAGRFALKWERPNSI